MAGIYIHIPFCKKACHYCNFHFSTGTDLMDQMVSAICLEISMRKEEQSEEVNTIYFGGGTPSILPADAIRKMLKIILNNYQVSNEPEITLEANPDDISTEKAAAWKEMGINRFSIGIQSFDQQYLKWMNRAHDAEQSFRCIDVIRNAGFDNFSIDLIYGTPGQTIGEWTNDVQQAIELKIPHLSCYALTVEEDTALHHLIKRGKKEKVDADEQALRFETLLEMTESAGYHHYEISNFALPGKESRHNSAYWEGIPYLGFGPSAHSFSENTRSWNIAHNPNYVNAILKGIRPCTAETLSPMDTLNEYIMTSLRSSKGIYRANIINRWGKVYAQQIEENIAPYLTKGLAVLTNEGWKLTSQGKFLADGIASNLFFLRENQ
jgi:oxygen-independent coproporphyrinogen-3 oxidase